MRSRRTIGHVRALAFVALLGLLGTACASAEGAEKDSLEVSAIWTGGEQDAFRKVLDAFEEQSGITVTYTPTGSNPGAVLGPRAQGGDPPDVAFLPQPGLMRDFQTRGFLAPLGDEVVSAIDEHYDEQWRELGTIDDEVYGLFFKAANKSTFWFNTAVFDDAGLEPPEDWEGLKELGAASAAYGVEPFSIAAADGWVLSDWFENIYLRTAGPETYEQLATHELPWDDASVVTALETFAEILQEDLVAKGLRGALLTDYPTSVENTFSDPPGAATVYEGDFTAGVISGMDVKLGEGADFFPFPAIDNDDPAVVAAGDVAVVMQDSEQAQQLLAFLASPEAAEIWAEQGGFISPNASVAMDVYPDEISKRAAEMLQEAETFQFDLSDRQPGEFGATVGRGMYRLLQDFFLHNDDPERVARELEEAATEAWAAIEEGQQ